MNFLAKTLGSLTGTSIPYTVGNVIQQSHIEDSSSKSLWKVYDAISDKESTPVSVFEFDLKHPMNSRYIPLAQNAVKRHRALSLLPGVLTIVEVIETDKSIYLITERVSLLTKDVFALSKESKILGIYQLAVGLKFINIEGSCVHGNLRLENVFVNSSSEWKIGGFEFTINYSDNSLDFLSLYSSYSAMTSSKGMVVPVEFENAGSECFQGQLKGAKGIKFDSYLFGCLIFQILTSKAPSAGEISRSSNLEGLPINKLAAPNAGLRQTVEQFLNNGQNSYFCTSEINAYARFSQVAVLNENEKVETFKALIYSNIPVEFLEVKVMPELKKTFDLTTSNENNIQTILIYLLYSIDSKSTKNSKSFDMFFKPVYFKAFLLADRAVRTILLKVLPNVVDRISKYEIQDKIYPNLVTGFQDTDITVRTETLLSISYIMDKITDRQLNNDLLRYLAKLQADSNPKLRANTVLCLTKISEKMQSNTRIGVLITAFGKALKDPDYVTRLCALRGFESSVDYFTPEICCSKVLSSLSPALLDKSSVIRDEAEKTFDIYMKKIRDESAKLGFNEEDDHIQKEVIDLSNLLNNVSLENLGESLIGNISTFSTPSGTPFPESRMNSFNFGKAPGSSNENLTDKNDLDFNIDDGWGSDENSQTNFQTVKSFAKPTKREPSTSSAANFKSSFSKPIEKHEPVGNDTAKKPLVLGKKKPVTKLKLNDDPLDEDDQGWGDGW